MDMDRGCLLTIFIHVMEKLVLPPPPATQTTLVSGQRTLLSLLSTNEKR